MYKHIFKQIKKFDRIVIARHVGPDPDALGSQVALREVILNAFPEKEVFAVGVTANKYKYFGIITRTLPDDFDKSKALLIVLDTPDAKRVDGADYKEYKYSIKMDHHPFIESFCDYEYIDDKSSSTCEIIIKLCRNSKLEITKNAAEKLFIGIVADTGRFLFDYTTADTLKTAAYLIENFELDVDKLYNYLYLKPLPELRFHSYIGKEMKVTKNGLAYIKIHNSVLEEYGVDAASAGNMINDFNYIQGVSVWMTLTEDVKMNKIRVSIRSRGPFVNRIAEDYGGGGHNYASGVKLESFKVADEMIKEYDALCKEYNKKDIE